jgi:hypothetical protein
MMGHRGAKDMSKPVAATITSKSRSVPSAERMPVFVKLSSLNLVS